MLKLLFSRSKRNILLKVCVIFFIIISYFLLKKLYYYEKQLGNLNQNIIRNSNENRNIFKVEKYNENNNKPGYNNSEVGLYFQSIKKHQFIDKYSIEKQPEINFYFEQIIKEEEEAVIPGLGEDGEPVLNLPNVTKEDIEQSVKKEAFNKILSDKISLTRRIPDARHSLCYSKQYDEYLPSASIIIIFIDEAWSSLMRTIYSALIRSPAQYLKEIILVDDASTRSELKMKLDYYLKTRLPNKVKILRLPSRSGLIKARLAGAKIASGDVLVFLDSHCECGIDWLQPLLQRIKENRKAVLCPIIDVIHDRHLGYMYSQDRQFQIGGFTWSGHFTWIPIPELEIMRRGSEIDPTRSPTMAGGLFAIDRSYFWEIGSYDSKMEVWGGENLEMSFRLWQCGGYLEIIPCSRVGHIFRSFHPYSFPGKKDTHGINTARMVEVWMDEYKRLFYLHRPDLLNINIGNISSRKKLRKILHCRNFKWYLENVIPQKFVLDENVAAYGRVKSKIKNFCFDNLNKPEDSSHDLGLYTCHNKLFSSQYFSLTLHGELRREELCAEVELRYMKIQGLVRPATGNVTLTKCNNSPSQIWIYENEMIRHVETNYCVHAYDAHLETLLTVAICDENDIYFKWVWEFVKLSDNDTFLANFI